MEEITKQEEAEQVKNTEENKTDEQENKLENPIKSWLERIGLVRYKSSFIKSPYHSMDKVKEMEYDDFRFIGVKRNDCLKLMNEVAKLNGTTMEEISKQKEARNAEENKVDEQQIEAVPWIESWLADMGFVRYSSDFIKNGYDTIDEVKKLTHGHLKQMGVQRVHGYQILKKIAELTDDPAGRRKKQLAEQQRIRNEKLKMEKRAKKEGWYEFRGDQFNSNHIGPSNTLYGKNIITRTKDSNFDSVSLLKNEIKTGSNHWLFRLNAIGEGFGDNRIIIGVWKVQDGWEPTDKCFTENDQGYGYHVGAKKMTSSDDYADYAKPFKAGAIIEMHLNMHAGKLSFIDKRNDQKLGEVFIHKKDTYKAAVNTNWTNDSVELIKYWN
eukprot:214517_1